MSGFKVLLNGSHMISVSTEGLNLLNVRIQGDTLSEEFSSVSITGGNYGDGKDSQHLIWLNDKVIDSGDVVEVVFLKDVENSALGKTIEDLYPQNSENFGPWQPEAEIIKQLLKSPKQREAFSLQITNPADEQIDVSTSGDDFTYSFSVMWNWSQPESASVCASSNSLQKIVNREDGTNFARFKIHFGQKVLFRAWA